MKIVFTTHTYYPEKNGVQVVTEYLAEGLAKKGHEVHIITEMLSGVKKEDIHNEVNINRVVAKVVHTFNIGEKKEFQELLLEKCKNADALINVCTQTALTDWSFPVLNKISCKKVLYLHGIIDLKINKNDFTSISTLSHKIWNCLRYKLYYMRAGKYFKMYDFVTQLHTSDIGYRFFEKKYGIKSVVIENAAENTFFNHASQICKDYILSVANFCPRKNQEMLLQAFYRSNLPESAKLILIGSTKNSYYSKLINLKQQLDCQYGTRNVELLTGVPRSDIYKYTKEAKIYLLGSRWEMFPISIIEAMASGIPFISTDVGCVKYLPGGVVVDKIDEMSYWLELLWNNEKVRRNLGTVGYNYARKYFTIENKVEQLEQLIGGNI